MKSMPAFLDSEQLEGRLQICSEPGGFQDAAHPDIAGEAAVE